jgi:probable HAF family extracellular repeat protein
VINASGQVAGMYNQDGEGFAFLTSTGGVQTIEPGTTHSPSVRGINVQGRLVGSASYPGSLWPRAFSTGAHGIGMTDLGTLGGLYSDGIGINSLGEVVGVSTTADVSRHAFVTSAGGADMVDLNSWVTLPDGANLSEAVAINDKGWIVANSGNGHAYLLTPVPEPETGALILAGLAAVVARARRHRPCAPTGTRDSA